MRDLVLESALRESAAEVLEKMFFISDEGEPEPGGDQNEPGGDQNEPGGDQNEPVGVNAAPELAARLTFEGSPPGWLALGIEKAAARSMAADFLGEDEEAITDQQAGDMLCELANMICGSVLSRTESDTTFHLSSPRVVPREEWPEPAGAAIRRVALAQGTLEVFMKTESPLCRSSEKFAS